VYDGIPGVDQSPSTAVIWILNIYQLPPTAECTGCPHVLIYYTRLQIYIARKIGEVNIRTINKNNVK